MTSIEKVETLVETLDTSVSSPVKQESRSRGRKRHRMFCFGCNRYEGHYIAAGGRTVYSFLLGLTLGLVSLTGPFQCQCCGGRRWLRFDALHPKFWLKCWSNARHSEGRQRS